MARRSERRHPELHPNQHDDRRGPPAFTPSAASSSGGILDQTNAEERRLLKFARRYTIDLPRAREAAILARPRCALDFDRPAAGDIVDQVRGVPDSAASSSGILDQSKAEERRLLKFARRYTIGLPWAREAAILARPRCALDFDRPAAGGIVDQVRGVPQRHPRAASSTSQRQKNGVS